MHLHRFFHMSLGVAVVFFLSGCGSSKIAVKLNSTPDGAEVFFSNSENSEGAKVGTTPHTYPESDFKDKKFVGYYLFKKEGFKPEKKHQDAPPNVPSNKRIDINVELQPITTITLNVTSAPPGATIYFQEENGSKPQKLGVAAPKYSATLNDEKTDQPPVWPKGIYRGELSGYKPKSVAVIQTSSNRDVQIELEPLPKPPMPPRVTSPEVKTTFPQPNIDVFPPADIAANASIAVLAFSDKSHTDASATAADKLIYKLQRKGLFVLEREITEKAKSSLLASKPERNNGPDVDMAKDLAVSLDCKYVLFGIINEFAEELENITIQPFMPDNEKQRYQKEYDEYTGYFESEKLPLPQKIKSLADVEQDILANLKPKKVKVARVNISIKLIDAILHSGTICVLSNIWNFNVSNVLSADLFWV